MVAAENVNVNNLGTISKSSVAGGQGKKIEGKYESLIFYFVNERIIKLI